MVGLTFIARALRGRAVWPAGVSGGALVAGGLFVLLTAGTVGCEIPTVHRPSGPGAPAVDPATPPETTGGLIEVRAAGVEAALDPVTGRVTVITGPWPSGDDQVTALVCPQVPAPGRYRSSELDGVQRACVQLPPVQVGGDGLARLAGVLPLADGETSGCRPPAQCAVVVYLVSNGGEAVPSTAGDQLVRTGPLTSDA